jgi:8-oxo-dGTP diphosphatase
MNHDHHINPPQRPSDTQLPANVRDALDANWCFAATEPHDTGSTDNVDDAAEWLLAADAVVFSPDDHGRMNVLLIERGNDPDDPFAGSLALPGGGMEWRRGETFEQAARRELLEETGLAAPDRMVQVGVYDAPERDPRGRVISVAFAGVLPQQIAPTAGDDAAAARWVAVDDVNSNELAFDHADILRAALATFPHLPRWR